MQIAYKKYAFDVQFSFRAISKISFSHQTTISFQKDFIQRLFLTADLDILFRK